jgi:hypothetical protein
LALVLAAAQAAKAQNYTLAEKPQGGECFHYHMVMNLGGDMRVVKGSKPAALKLTATATHDFAERLLVVDSHGQIQKTARAYDVARADISLDQSRSQRQLRPERRLLVAQQYKGTPMTYCPMGPLTPEEYELTSGHFDTLTITGLLPGRPVAIGDTWKVPNDAVQAICTFEGLTFQDLKCVLEKVQNDSAHVAVTGSASGIDQGAQVKLTIRASYQFDLKSSRLSTLEWKQKDERDQGPASPATSVESSTQVSRALIAQPPALSDVGLICVPEGFEPPVSMTQLAYHHDGKMTFDLVYPRDWQVVGQNPEHVVLRLLDRGDFVAQVTISPWTSARPGEHMSPEAFREAMAKTPGWEQGEVVEDGELPPENGGYVYRFSAPGMMDKMKVVQNFYLVAGPLGEQVVLAFTMTAAQAEKLGTRDLAVVRGLSFPGRKDPN